MSDDLKLKGLQLLKDNLEVFSAHCLKVKPKKPGPVVPFIWNEAQHFIHKKLEEQRERIGYVRAILSKGRQQGCSTYVAARFYHRATTGQGVTAFIVAHEQKATDNLYQMVRRYHDHNPMPVSTGATNAKELIFDKLDGGYKLATAGTKDVGRSNTAQLLHGSEVGFWANAEAHMAGLGNTIADVPGTEIILESTANGLGNYYHKAWQDAEAGKSNFIPIFVPWYWQQEYRAPVRKDLELSEEDVELMRLYGVDMEQMQWRANKIASYGEGFAWLFKQEYPFCVSGDARVGTARGMIPMRELLVGDKLASGEVRAAWRTGAKPVVRVRTKLGYEVVCTPEHRLGMADGSWLRADQAVGGRLKLCQPQASTEYVSVSWRVFNGVDAGMVIDERWGRLLGLIAGDGGLTTRSLSIACDSKDADLIELVRGLAAELIAEPGVRHGMGSNGGGSEVRLSDVAMGDMWHALGVLEKGPSGWKRKICVPECIWRSPLSVVREFLRGIYEADGFAGYDGPRVTIFSKHQELLQDIQQLLLLFGITARRVSRPAINGQGFSYTSNTLDLRVAESIAFARQIGFLSERKQSRCAGWMNSHVIGRNGKQMLLEDVVESVSDAGETEVYDATVPGLDCFDASGILVHNCSSEAFQTGTMNPLVSPHYVNAAATGTYYDDAGALIIGCDPASDGAGTVDRTCIAFRKGRVVFRVEYHDKKNSMQVAGLLADYNREFNPDAIFVDKGGIGTGIVDRLNELNIPVVGVMFGAAASNPDLYANKKAEIWWRMKDWFEEQPNRIVNNPAFIADICAPQPDVSSNGRKILESKEKLDRRGIRSPDGGDALALTFTEFVLPKHISGGSGKPYEAASKAGY